MMVSRTLHYFMSPIDLLYKDKKCERMRHDKIRNSKSLVWYIREYFEINTITPSDDKNNLFTQIFRIFEHCMEFTRSYTFSSFIEEYDASFHLFEGIYDEESLLYFDIFRICMRNWLDTFYSSEFAYTFFVFFYASIEMFIPISNSKNRNHSITRNMRNRQISIEDGEK